MPRYPGGKEARDARKREIEQALEAMIMGCDEVIAATGIPRSTVSQYIRELHDEKRVHIHSWRIEKFKTVALYKAGKGKDAERPPRPRKVMTDDELEQKIFRRKPVVVDVRKDPLIWALFERVPA